jgi:aminopeptidase
MNNAFLERYADVLLEAVNLQKGQCLLVRSEPIHARFAGILARRAYIRGARYVRFDQNEVENPYLYEARIGHSREEYLDYVPPFRVKMMEEMIADGWALIAIKSPEDPDMLERLDQGRNARCAKATAIAMKDVSTRISSNEIAWLVAFLPSERLAAKIMGMDAGPEAVEALWKVLIPILHLDRDDPAASFRAHSEGLAARAARLNSLRLDGLRFKGPGTDLFVGLSPASVWRGGPDVTKGGVPFNPNLPTEEVFTSPDWRRTEGVVRFTMPVLIPSIGKIVRGGWLRFEGGVAADWGAESGKDALDAYFSIDPSAKRLGEVALVDAGSPIAKAGRCFYNILLDENASCHIALGSSYESCLKGGESLSKEEKEALGANDSPVHTDFMIGGPEVSVVGLLPGGKEAPIIEKGDFVL